MISDKELHKNIQLAIEQDIPSLTENITISVKDGVITLYGVADDYAIKIKLENVIKKIKGVKAMLDKIKVNLGLKIKKDKNQILLDTSNNEGYYWEYSHDRVIIKNNEKWVIQYSNIKTEEKNINSELKHCTIY